MKILRRVMCFFLVATILCACGKESERKTIDGPQVALAELKDKRITFTCLTNQESCWTPVNLAAQFPEDSTFTLGPIFYLNNSRVFAIVDDTHPFPWERYVILVDSAQPNFQSLRLSGDSGRALFAVAGGKLVVAQDGNTEVLLIDQNLKSETIDVGIAVNRLIVKDDTSVILLNNRPNNENNSLFLDLVVLAVNTRQLQSHHLELPGFALMGSEVSLRADKNYLVSLEGVSRNIRQAYGLFLNGSDPHNLQLGAISLDNPSKPPAALKGSHFSASVGFAQYHEILFVGSLGGEYGRGGFLIDMNRLEEMVDTQDDPDLRTGKKLIVPFGDAILLGTYSQVLQINMDGAIINRFPLPKNTGNNYTIIIYQK